MLRRSSLVMFLAAVSFVSAAGIDWRLTPMKTVKLEIPHAPDDPLMVRRVAFSAPVGTCANEARQLIDTMLIPGFQANRVEVLERERLNQLMAELRFTQSDAADPRTALALGRILGPSAMIVVDVNTCSVDKIPLRSSTTALNGASIPLYISKTRASLIGSSRIVDLSTGQIIGSYQFNATPELQNESKEGQPEFPAPERLRSSAMELASGDITHKLFPWTELKPLVIYDDKDCNMKEGAQVLINGDVDAALAQFTAGMPACQNDPKKAKSLLRAYYNLGLVYCMKKDFSKADQNLKLAMQGKGADAIAGTAEACHSAESGLEAVSKYQVRVAAVPAPPPIGSLQQASAPKPNPAAAKSDVPGGAAAANTDVEARIRKLDELLKKGLITRKQYDARKQAILDSL